MATKRIAVVTGAANGIGQAYAVRLAKDGFDIAVADVVEPLETKKMVEAEGRRFFSAIVDVSSEEATLDFATQVKENLGLVTALVNNAGIYPPVLFSDLDYKTWKKVIGINLDGTFLMCKAFVPQMLTQKYGRIVNIASTTFFMNTPKGTAYIASKGGVIGLTRALASEVGAHGITANVVAPGLIDTKNNRKLAGDEVYEVLPKMQAIPQIIQPVDMTGTVSFLCSEDSALITAQTIAVDGGQIRI